MPAHSADIRITESGGSPTAKTALIEVKFEWELKKPIPIMKWRDVSHKRSGYTRIGDKGEGDWSLLLLGGVEFYEWKITGGGILGPDYEHVLTFEFFDIPFQLEFPFKSGMKGTGMYHLYHTPFFHGGLDFEVL